MRPGASPERGPNPPPERGTCGTRRTRASRAPDRRSLGKRAGGPCSAPGRTWRHGPNETTGTPRDRAGRLMVLRQPGGRRAAAFVVVTVLIDAMGIGVIMPVMPDLIRELTDLPLGAAALWGGYLSFVYALMQFAFGPTLGNLSDRFGRRPVLLLSLFALAVDYLIMGFAPTLWAAVRRPGAGRRRRRHLLHRQRLHGRRQPPRPASPELRPDRRRLRGRLRRRAADRGARRRAGNPRPVLRRRRAGHDQLRLWRAGAAGNARAGEPEAVRLASRQPARSGPADRRDADGRVVLRRHVPVRSRALRLPRNLELLHQGGVRMVECADRPVARHRRHLLRRGPGLADPVDPPAPRRGRNRVSGVSS